MNSRLLRILLGKDNKKNVSSEEQISLIGIRLGMTVGTLGCILMCLLSFGSWSFIFILSLITLATILVLGDIFVKKISLPALAHIIGIFAMIGTDVLIFDRHIPMPVGNIWIMFSVIYMALFFSKNAGRICSVIGYLLTVIGFAYRYYSVYGTIEGFLSNREYMNSLISLFIVSLVAVAGLIMYKMMLFNEKAIAQENEAKALKASSTSKIFLANMSHEIRTPLNAIIGYNDLIYETDSIETIKKYSKVIEKNSNFLLMLLNDILDYSKIESSHLDLVPEDYDVREMIEDCGEAVENAILEKGIKYECFIADNVPQFLNGDAIRIRQCIVNLLNNAIKYTFQGTVALNVGIEEVNKEDYKLHISVTDTGIGIKEYNKEKIFDRYMKLSKSSQGSGLGLSITKGIVEFMGGEITVESEIEEGSKFSFYVLQKKAQKSEDENLLLLKKNVNVLAVDDMKINIMLLENFCKMLGDTVQFDFAYSGVDAIEKCEVKNYDIIFMDHMMPGLDGIETFKEIKKGTMNVKTPVIMVTANSQPGDKESYIDVCGFDDYLPKPIRITDFRKIMQRWTKADIREVS